MKKRIISLLMVALMLVSLVPMGALAAGNTTITKQPSDKSAAVGETVTFEIAATNPNSTDLEYLWFDADKAQKENIDLSDLSSDIKNKLIISKLKAEGVKLGEGQTLELAAERNMNIRCVVYYIITIGEKVTVEFPKDLALSNTVTLTVTGGETPVPSPSVSPTPSPSTSPTPSESPTPSPSPSVDPDTCTHTNLKYVSEKAGT